MSYERTLKDEGDSGQETKYRIPHYLTSSTQKFDVLDNWWEPSYWNQGLSVSQAIITNNEKGEEILRHLSQWHMQRYKKNQAGWQTLLNELLIIIIFSPIKVRCEPPVIDLGSRDRQGQMFMLYISISVQIVQVKKKRT